MAVQIMPPDPVEEVSGWWPSERSTKARLKALFTRNKSNRMGRTFDVGVTEFQGPEVINAQPSEVSSDQRSISYPTWPSRPSNISKQTGRQNRLLRAQKSLPNLFQASKQSPIEAFPTELPQSSGVFQSISQPKKSRNASRSMTDSSVHTLNSLDNLRDRSFSDNHSMSTVHTSFSSYTSQTSTPLDSSFSSTESCDPPVPKEPVPSPSLGREVQQLVSQPRLLANAKRPAPRGTTSLDTTTNNTTIEDDAAQKPLPAVPSSHPQLDSNGRRISIVAPLPEPGHIRKTSARYRCEPRGASTEPTTPTSPVSRPSSIRSSGSTRVFEPNHKRVSSYSLFPRTPSTGHSPPSANNTPASPPIPITTRPERAVSDSRILPSQPAPTLPIRPDRSSSNPTTSLSIPPRRGCTKRHGILPVPLSLTSTVLPSPLISPASISSCHSEVKPPPPLRLAKAPTRLKITRQKSMPSLHAISPPSGPPPSVPLPALPTGLLC